MERLYLTIFVIQCVPLRRSYLRFNRTTRSCQMRFDVGKLINLVKLNFQVKSDWKTVFDNICNTFSTTPKKLSQCHSSQIQPHHAHRRQMRFGIGKFTTWENSICRSNLMKKWSLKIFVIHWVPLRRSYLSATVLRSNRTMRTAVIWGMKSGREQTWKNSICRLNMMKKRYLKIFVIHSVPLQRNCLSVTVPRYNHTMHTAIIWGLTSGIGWTW